MKGSVNVCNQKIFVVIGLIISTISCAQVTDQTMSKEVKAEVIEAVNSLLLDNYVYPEVAHQMDSVTKAHLASGRYDSVTIPAQFATLLTEDLYQVSKDKHLRVSYSLADGGGAESGRHGQRNDFMEDARRGNFGFHEVKVLKGNVGYLDLRGFFDARIAGKVAHESMGKLIDTDALIIDLRENGGGSPSMIQLISSYLFGEQPVHLNSFYWRPGDSYSETWTLSDIPGKHRPDWPVYVLTSEETFSAAEEFSYNLKHLKRATLIGETTGGGAHPGGIMSATKGFNVWVPKGRAINPVTGTNWEGTGVSPHISVEAVNALQVACQKVILDLVTDCSDEFTRLEYNGLLKELETNPTALFPD